MEFSLGPSQLRDIPLANPILRGIRCDRGGHHSSGAYLTDLYQLVVLERRTSGILLYDTIRWVDGRSRAFESAAIFARIPNYVGLGLWADGGRYRFHTPRF